MQTMPRLAFMNVVVLLLAALVAAGPARGQIPTGLPSSDAEEAEAVVPDSVDVAPSASDDAISSRLGQILASTGWFTDPVVRVDEGVVFLSGQAESEARRVWAGDLARQTEAVVAVVNRMEVPERSPWDLGLLRSEVSSLIIAVQRALPYLLFAAVILFLSGLAARLAGNLVRRSLRRRIPTVLLLDLVARAAGLLVFLVGFYLVLRVSGLTRLAMTLIGGTGVAALVIGIAFRDIMENFLASLLISLRRPFSVGDVVEISGHLGVIQKVTTRGTLLMSLDGNHIQIPNATVYKSQIVNFTANPKRRMEFVVGIGYDDDLAEAQAAAREAMERHPAVLDDPGPLVLADELAASTVNLRFFFWYDGTQHDGRKVRSALIRSVKRTLEEGGFSMPDEAREVIFPDGVPIREAAPEPAAPPAPKPARKPQREATALEAEGGLDSEHQEIQAQAAEARSPEEGEDLLSSNG